MLLTHKPQVHNTFGQNNPNKTTGSGVGFSLEQTAQGLEQGFKDAGAVIALATGNVTGVIGEIGSALGAGGQTGAAASTKPPEVGGGAAQPVPPAGHEHHGESLWERVVAWWRLHIEHRGAKG